MRSGIFFAIIAAKVKYGYRNTNRTRNKECI